MNDGIKTVESRFLLDALVCAVLLIANYFALLGTPWGHQFDHDAFLGRKMLGREIITFDSDILKLIRKRTKASSTWRFLSSGTDCHIRCNQWSSG
jgi:hypothetical protein